MNHYKHITPDQIEDQNGNRLVWYGPEFEGTISEEDIEKFEEYRHPNITPPWCVCSEEMDRVATFNGSVMTYNDINYEFRKASRPKEVEQPVQQEELEPCGEGENICNCKSKSECGYLEIEKRLVELHRNNSNLTNDAIYQPVQQEARQYPIGGYAPGNYWCVCRDCKERFHGDKRSFQCEPCAIKMVQPSTPIVEEQTLPNIKDFLVKRLNMTKYQAENLYEDYILACDEYAKLYAHSISNREEGRELQELITYFIENNMMSVKADEMAKEALCKLTPSSTPLEQKELKEPNLFNRHICNYKIIQTNNWKNPLPEDNAWGLQCTVCESLICIGSKKSELKESN